jgi:hypothetical protein
MPWQDRIRKAAYRSPKGTRMEFQFKDVARRFRKRTTVFEFAGVDESYVQQNGYSSRAYPIRAYFSGPEHDRQATQFEALILEHGIGRLEHPFYGPVDVIPVGEITRRDDLVTAANQTVIELEFSTSLATLYPTSQVQPQSEVLAALAAFGPLAAKSFADAALLDKAASRASLTGSVRNLLNSVSKNLEGIADAVASISRTFHDIEDTINHGLDVFVGQPLLLAQQISDLIKSPSRAFAGLSDRMNAYSALADDIFGSEAGRPEDGLVGTLGLPVNGEKAANGFHLADVAAMASLAGLIEACVAEPIADRLRTAGSSSSVNRSSNPTSNLPGVGARIQTRPQAQRAAQAIAARFDALVAWRDAGYATLNAVPIGSNRTDPLGNARLDTGEAYQQIQSAVALATGFLVEISFSKVPERRLITDRPRTILDLCAELYGRVDNDTLDLFIVTNDLSGDEILEVGAKRELLYYPEAA